MKSTKRDFARRKAWQRGVIQALDRRMANGIVEIPPACLVSDAAICAFLQEFNDSERATRLYRWRGQGA